MVDEVDVIFKAGKGGDGIVSFRHEKYIPKGGPDGGDGGYGGNVVLVSSDDLHGLSNFRFRKEFVAENGTRGGENNKSGKKGQNLVLKVPVGTVLKHKDGEVIFDFNAKGVEYTVCYGGEGGKGNARFKSSVNTTPRQFTYGKEGDRLDLRLDLNLRRVGCVVSLCKGRNVVEVRAHALSSRSSRCHGSSFGISPTIAAKRT